DELAVEEVGRALELVRQAVHAGGRGDDGAGAVAVLHDGDVRAQPVDGRQGDVTQRNLEGARAVRGVDADRARPLHEHVQRVGIGLQDDRGVVVERGRTVTADAAAA